MITCEYCNKEFKRKYEEQKFCSYNCSNGAKKVKLEKRKCKHFNKEFEVHPSSAQRFCSCACSNGSRKKELIERTCIHCGKKFYRKESQLKIKGNGKYCSPHCRSTHTKVLETGKEVFKEIRKCECCGKEFETYKRLTQKYCSKKCSSNHRWDKERKKELNENFDIFYNDYVRVLKEYEFKNNLL